MRHLRTIYESNEDIRIASVILRTILGLFAAFAVVIGISFSSGDMTLIMIMLVGGLFLTLPVIFVFRGHIRLSSLILLVNVVTTMTIVSILGKGIHDIAILAYPVAIFFANLILRRRDFLWLSFFILLVVGYLGLGEMFGWYIPNNYKDTIAVDLISALIILLLTIMIADSLAENIRKNTQVAQEEIALRRKAQAQLRHLNIHDNPTGIYNRAFFDEMLSLKEHTREYPVSIIFADIDNLKEFNDKQGHAGGDDLLKRAAKTLSNAFRDGDILARIGGDEFAVILPKTDSTTANNILKRLYSILAAHNTKNPTIPIHISFGISTAEKGDLKNALKDADHNMYENKANRKLR